MLYQYLIKYNKLAITSANTHNLAYKNYKKNIKKQLYYEEYFLQTPSKPVVLEGKTFSHTPDCNSNSTTPYTQLWNATESA